MKLKIIYNLKIYEIECDVDEPIENLKALIEIEIGVQLDQQTLMLNDKVLSDNQIIKTIGIKTQDILILLNSNNFTQRSIAPMMMPQFQGFQPQQMAQMQSLNDNLLKEANALKQQYLNNPEQLNFILHQNHDLAEAVLNEDPSVLVQYIYKQKMQLRDKQLAEFKKIEKLNQDPFNPEYQTQIYDNIQQVQVDEQLEFAQEYIPESFGQVTMLYIEANINNIPIQAFVDSGAQNTIISTKCAERCGLMRLIDKRFKGMAIGVGSAAIVGRIHTVNLQINDKFINCSLTVLESDKTDFLLGLDMLKRHQCIIDLAKNLLRFNNDEFSIQFLPEKDIKKMSSISSSQLIKQQEDEELKQAYELSKKLSQSPQQPMHQQQAQQQQKSPFPESSIEALMKFGITRENAIQLLFQCQGNVELAASVLFQ